MTGRYPPTGERAGGAAVAGSRMPAQGGAGGEIGAVHEFALAEAVWATAIDEVRRRGRERMVALDVRVGQLQRIDREVFELALQETGSRAVGSLAEVAIRVAVEPARFRCRACDRRFGLAEAGAPGDGDDAEAIHFVPELAHALLACPGCGSPDFEILEGRGVHIAEIETR